jgi:MFS family permease
MVAARLLGLPFVAGTETGLQAAQALSVDRSPRPQETVLDNPCPLSLCHRRHRFFVELLELPPVPFPYRRRNWGRVCGNQLSHRRIGSATFWIGAALGAGGTLFLLNSGLVSPTFGWRFAFSIGALLGLVILVLRKSVPESPRWLMLRGFEDQAEAIVRDIEQNVSEQRGDLNRPEGSLKIAVRDHTPLKDVWNAIIHGQPKRSLLGLALMIGQSFFYNAVFFTYGLVLVQFFNVKSERVSMYILPLTLGNFMGPLILGRFFDSIGRKKMITLTYGVSGLLLIGSALMFRANQIGPLGQDIWFTAIFFIASAAASSAYLTVSEVFPLEIRAFAISIFYAVGTLVGGVGTPILFAKLISSGNRSELSWGYLLAAVLMLVGAATEATLGVNAERQSLESISTPLQADGQAR